MSEKPAATPAEFQLHVAGLDYWTLMKRFNQNRDQPLTRRAVVKAMRELLARTKEPSLRNRITRFIAVNQAQPPSNSPDPTGPRYA